MAKEIDPDVARFAAYVREQEQREKASKRAEREARQQADATKALVAAKDAAAAEVKRLRSRQGVSAEERAAADAAYREALAAVVAAETGTAPAWAPPPGEAEPTDDAAAEPAAGSDDAADATDCAEDPAADDEVVES
ncbi:MAG: hypothetical protein KF703_13585 [Actinobacteria bacterium]|nr:hypothetical protein [Actinomycetota bacterium]